MTKDRKKTIFYLIKDAAIVLGVIATAFAVWSKTSGSLDSYVDKRACEIVDEKTAPIVKELVFLNCMFRVSLTPEQQKQAEELYKQVTKIGEK